MSTMFCSTHARPRTLSSIVAVLLVVSAAGGIASAGPLAYEPFDYAAGPLGSASGGTGFSGNWSSNSTTNVVATDLTYGDLETAGGSIGNLGGGENRFGASRGIDLSTPGLLADDQELWFSVIMGYDAGGNRTNSTLMFVLGDEAMSGGNFDYNFNTAGATGLGVFVGRDVSNGKIKAVQVRDTTFGSSGFAGNVYGTGGGTAVLPGANTNVDYKLVVGRITWGDGSDTIDLFLPDENLVLGAVHSTLTVDVDQSGYDFITFKRGDKMVMDEIRFGATSADVLPVPEPGLTALLGLCGLWWCGATRRKR
jgi:hypothetical protein